MARPRAARPRARRSAAPSTPASAPASPPASRPAPASTPAPAPASAPHAGARFELEGLIYELDRAPRPQGRRSVVVVRLAEHPTDPGFRDRVDLFAHRGRVAFARRVADAFGRQVSEVAGQLAVILDAVERAAAHEHAAREPAPGELCAARRAAAEELLAAPDLLEQAAGALAALGQVGEEETKRLCYLVAVSRLLARPLNALLLAPSGTGKSTLLDAVAALVPPEQVESLARLTAHSLYYRGQDALRHKLVLVDEYEGAGEADHSLRVLQSKGELRLSRTVQGRAETLVVRGPVAVMSGTTSSALDPQNTSRCLELTLDDGPAQTRRIQAAQARAAAGLAGSGPDLTRWRDAQRLLAPATVVVPYAERLRFPARTSVDRRGSGRLLGLVMAHALLCQRQRGRDAQGRLVAEVADYRVVYELVAPLAGRALEDLPPRAAAAYRELCGAASALERRALAARLGWSYNTAKAALADLVAHELAWVAEAGPPARYRPLERGTLGLGGGETLTPPAELD